MRILYLSTWFPHPPDNGSKIRAYHLLRALAEAHAVTLVSFAYDTARPDQAGDLRSLCVEIQVVSVDPFAANRVGILRAFLSARPVAFRQALRRSTSICMLSVVGMTPPKQARLAPRPTILILGNQAQSRTTETTRSGQTPSRRSPRSTITITL